MDYRALHEKVNNVVYPLPNIAEIVEQLGGAVYFTRLDLAAGFQILKPLS